MADEWPMRIWMAVIPALFVIGAARECEVNLAALANLQAIFWTGVGMVLAWLLGCFVAMLFAWFVLGPIYYDQGLKNGAPFQPGDRVIVLPKPYRGTISQVYSLWQGDTVRVRLGERESDEFRDIFGPAQLMRVDSQEKER